MPAVYLDHYAATRPLPEVVDAMLVFLREDYANASSLHEWGDRARLAVEDARAKVKRLLGAPESGELIFTANGTEANNLAIKGIARAQAKKGKHLIVSSVEHFSVLHAARTLEKDGYEVSLLPVDSFGVVDPEEVRRAIRPDTILVSVMTANGEVGTIEPIREIAAIAREAGVPLHTDAVAAAGSIPIDVEDWGVDAISIAADIFYGPKGAGALWVRKGVRLIPQMEGGVQEDGRRAGTENVPAIVGMGVAAELAARDLEKRAAMLAPLRDDLIRRLPEAIDRVYLSGHPANRLPWNASFLVEFIEGEGMLLFLNNLGVGVSSGSACTSRALKSSHVLDAMGVPAELAQGSLLFSFGLDNTPEDVDYVIEKLPPIVERLRQMSPLYDKFLKKGGE